MPKSIYDLFNKTRNECEIYQTTKHTPSRSKANGLRTDIFGDITFINHYQVPLRTRKPTLTSITNNQNRFSATKPSLKRYKNISTSPSTLHQYLVTYRQLAWTTTTVRTQTITYRGITPLELAFGQKPTNLIQFYIAIPTQLTIDRNKNLQQSKLNNYPSRHSKRLVSPRTSGETLLRTSG